MSSQPRPGFHNQGNHWKKMKRDRPEFFAEAAKRLAQLHQDLPPVEFCKPLFPFMTQRELAFIARGCAMAEQRTLKCTVAYLLRSGGMKEETMQRLLSGDLEKALSRATAILKILILRRRKKVVD